MTKDFQIKYAALKETIDKVKRQSTEWENKFVDIST